MAGIAADMRAGRLCDADQTCGYDLLDTTRRRGRRVLAVAAATGASPADKTVLRNARVFDGHQRSSPTSVVIQAGVIGTDAHGARIIDCAGGVLLPGLIDSHHLTPDPRRSTSNFRWRGQAGQ